MITERRYFDNLYRDSVTLMQHAARIAQVRGVRQASLVMATAANLGLLAESGLADADTTPRPNDVLLALEADDRKAVTAAVAVAERLLQAPKADPAGSGALAQTPPHSFDMALARMPGANLALISCPGDYAAAEAEKALRLGLDVMIFSDNVTLDDEVRLKALAADTDQLVMGPDCGTAIVHGMPLGFANVVARGNIGIVAASGTGLQQVACLIDRFGAGVSHALGTGGRDLSAAVGGVSMIRAIEMLARDDLTDVLVLISKPPAPEVVAPVVDVAARSGKPTVVCFLDDTLNIGRQNIWTAATLADAAQIATALSTGCEPAVSVPVRPDRPMRSAPGQRFIRGLYSGGTFCYEAQLILHKSVGGLHSTTPIEPTLPLADPWRSQAHSVIDFGDDLFTRGRPHPMIDHRLRNDRIVQEANDPGTAVILLDVVLGHGSHGNPAAEIAPVVRAAHEIASTADRDLAIIGFVCGTKADPQDLERQETMLREAGMILARHNADAVRQAADITAGIGTADRSQDDPKRAHGRTS